MPSYQLGFADYAREHPEIGKPLSDERYFAADVSVQIAEHGVLFYAAESNAIQFIPTTLTPDPPAPGALVEAIDCSSNNGLDIGGLIDDYAPAHVITKLYQSIELGGSGARYSIAQANTARGRGCTVSGYGWLYAGIGGARQANEFVATAGKAGIEFGPTNPLWLDCEDYTDGSYPDLGVIRQAVEWCERTGIPCGIYTGGWWWKPRTGNSTEFSHLPLWSSNYVGHAGLVEPGYGGWTLDTLGGTQWSGNPVDRSTFKAEYATP